MAEPALARAHRHGRVALGELDRVEALGDRALQVLDADVLAEADEAVLAVTGARRHDRAELAGHRPTASMPGGQVGRDEDAARRRRTRPVPRPGRAASTRAGGAGRRQRGRIVPGSVDRDRGEHPAPPLGRDAAGSRSRRSTTSTTSTPARASSAAASMPRASAPRRPRARPAGSRSRGSAAARRRASITPRRSLPWNSSGCSIAPVATTIRSRAPAAARCRRRPARARPRRRRARGRAR